MRKSPNRLFRVLSACCLLSLLFTGAAFAQTVTVEATPQSGAAPFEVSFTAQPSGIDDPCDYYWDFGDGWDDWGGSGASHTYTQAGDYTITVEVYDCTSDEYYYGSTAVHVDAPEAPTVSIQADPLNGVAPLLVNFSAQYQGYANPCDGYYWDLDGDGGYEEWTNGPTLSYTFNQAGSYSATVRIYDCYTNQNYTSSTPALVEVVSPKLSIGSLDGVHWGETITVPVTLTTEGVAIASLDNDIHWDTNKLELVEVTIGDAATAAGKELFYEVNPEWSYSNCWGWWWNNFVRIGVIGPQNNTAIGDGVVANLVFTVKSNIPQNQNATWIEGCSAASSPLAEPISLQAENGLVSIVHLWGDCSEGEDGAVDISEVYGVIDMFLGRIQVGSCADRNMNNWISIDEVQLSIDNFLEIDVPSLRALRTSDSPFLFLKPATARAGKTVKLPVVFARKDGAVSAVSADILYDASLLDEPAALLGPAAEATGKEVFFETVEPGKLRVGIAGANADLLEKGVVAYVTFKIKPGANARKTKLSCIFSATSPGAEKVSLKKASRTAKIQILKRKNK